MKQRIKLIECPRDAMQGLHDFVPTDIKAAYINHLLKVGFDTLDFGSFVSPKAIPQMRDTAEVLNKLDLSSPTKLLAIVANLRGVNDALQHEQIDYLGFPFSVSETFQQRNTNSSIEDSLTTVEEMLDLCHQKGKEAVIYLSMGFGNPYGDEWSPGIVAEHAGKLIGKGVKILSIADTTGVSTPQSIESIFKELSAAYPQTEWGMHLHSTPAARREKIEASWQSGCRRIDSAIKGFGGCPMAADELTGNIATEDLVTVLTEHQEDPGLDLQALGEAIEYSGRIFGNN